MGKSRSRRHRRRRGGENSLQQVVHGTEAGADKFTHVVMKEPDKFADAIGGELTGKETRRNKAKRKLKEAGGQLKEVGTQVTNFLKKLKFWGGRRRRTRRGRRRRRRTRRCRPHRRRCRTKRHRRRRSRRSRTKHRRRTGGCSRCH